MSVNKSKIGNKIKHYRMLKKLTQKELGKITRIGEATIRKYELGIRNPKIDKLILISNALDIPINTLLELEVKKNEENIMENVQLGNRIQILRKQMGYSQKSFAEFLNIPQPSISAYENGHNSPTIDVLINISRKCNVSIDWLAGLSDSKSKITNIGMIADCIYSFLELNEVDVEIKSNSIIFHDNISIEILNKINEHSLDIKSNLISKDAYEFLKYKTKEYYSSYLLTYKNYPNLSHEERLKMLKENLIE